MERIGRLLFFCFMIIFFAAKGSCQDIHFSQFYACPLNVNPAYTGLFEGDFRMSFNYKRQWSVISPFNTTAFTYEKPVFFKGSRLGMGAFVVNDITHNGTLVVSKVNFAGAYHKVFPTDVISAGFQLGLGFRHLKNDIMFPNQYNPVSGSFDPAASSGEQIDYNMFNMDFNVGASWQKEFTSKLDGGLGYAVYHLHGPIFSNYPFGIRHTANLMAKYQFSEIMYITPMVLMMATTGTKEMYFGGNFTYIFLQDFFEKSVFGGLYYKNKDAMVFVTGLNYNQWQFGLSYDLNVSGLRVASGMRGGFEISVVYKEISTRINQFTIPCERF